MRRAQVDEGSQPHRNLAGNPGFNYTSGTQTIRTNLFPNPSFEFVGSTADVRTNYFPNPGAVNSGNLIGWEGIAPNAIVTSSVAAPWSASGFARKQEWTNVSGNANTGDFGAFLQTPYTTIGIGQKATARMRVKTNRNVTMPAPSIYASSGVATKVAGSPGIAAVAEVPFVAWITFTADATAVASGLRMLHSSWAKVVGDTIEYSEIDVYPGDYDPNRPYFDGTNGVTNIISNTRGTSAYADYAGAGNQTITGNVAVTGNPDGITTANRVTYSAGATNPGITFVNPAIVGAQYTMSAWVFHETVVSGSQAFAQAGVAGMPSPPPIVQGVWQKITWTYTATSANQIGFRVGSPGGAGSYLITGIVVDRTSVPSAFYEGLGDYTYAWQGTVNNSVSYQRAPNISNWVASTTAVTHQSVHNPVVGSKCGAIITKGAYGDGVFSNGISATAGTTYTSSIWIKTTSAHNLTGVIRFMDSGGSTLTDVIADVTASVPVGTWTRVSVTGTAPANTNSMMPMWRVYAAHTPTTYYVDGALVESLTALLSYFDGTTAASGDFTYNWSGTAHASTSNQRAPILPQVTASRSSAVLDSKFFGYQGIAEDGVKTLKFFTPRGTANSSWRVAQISGASTAGGWDSTKVKAGGTYTFWMRYRSSGWVASQTFQMQIADGSNLNPVVLNTSPIALNASGWQELRRTFTALRDATAASQIYMALPTTPHTATDGVFEIREWMLVEGEYNGDYIDGTKPFSKWEGTANQSTSIGYPQQLLDIAGKPILDYTAPGTYTLDDSFGNTEARTFYTVIDNLGENFGGVSPIIQYGGVLNDVNPNTYIQLRQDANSQTADGLNSLFARRTGASGANAIIKIGRHVGAWGITATGKIFMQADGYNRVVDTATMDILHKTLLINSDQPLNKHLRTIMYRGEHDDATRLAVSRYLGNKYGANVV